MLTIEPTGAVLGATARGIDLAQGLSDADFGRILLSLGRYGVLRFPDQHLDLGALKRFSERFGEIQGSATRDLDRSREYPEIDILSNLKEGGKYIGSPDAGQDWHTDMTYRDVAGFVNVLYGIRIPRRDGKPLGGTEFANMHAAYDDLPADIKARLDGMTATHDIEKFWNICARTAAARGRR
jgi:taurine dioxygenase